MLWMPALSKRLALEIWADEAATNSIPLLEMLKSVRAARFTTISTGQIALSVSGGGYTTSLKLPSPISTWTEENVAMLGQQLIEVYRNALITLANSNVPVTEPTDAQILSTMLDSDELTTCKQTVHDITLIRYPGYGPAIQ